MEVHMDVYKHDRKKGSCCGRKFGRKHGNKLESSGGVMEIHKYFGRKYRRKFIRINVISNL